MKVSVQEVLHATGGRLLRGEPGVLFEGVSTDTRTLRPGMLFVALRGVNFDAHDFVGRALARGARGVIVDRAVGTRAHGAVIRVGDTLRALGDLAGFWRAIHPVPLAAVTGSNGKTTTKEILAGILSAAGYRVLKTEGNLNNLIGVPLMLFRLTASHDAAVLELGASRFGEIARLAEIAMPQAGIITTIGEAHLKFFRSLRGVARAKGELLSHLPAAGTAVLNADDPMMRDMGRRRRGRTLYFGFSPRAEVRCLSAADRGAAGSRVVFDVLGTPVAAEVTLPGRHNVQNALAAVAGASALDLRVPRRAIRAGLRTAAIPSGRFGIRRKRGVVIIDDTYNANPPSMEAALRALSRLKGRGRGVAILGDMLELGAAEGRAHERLGREAAACGVDRLIVMGRNARRVRAGALRAGMPGNSVHLAGSHREAAEAAGGILRKGDCVLVKGSRGMRMEEVVKALGVR